MKCVSLTRIEPSLHNPHLLLYSTQNVHFTRDITMFTSLRKVLEYISNLTMWSVRKESLDGSRHEFRWYPSPTTDDYSDALWEHHHSLIRTNAPSCPAPCPHPITHPYQRNMTHNSLVSWIYETKFTPVVHDLQDDHILAELMYKQHDVGDVEEVSMCFLVVIMNDVWVIVWLL